MQRLEVSGAVRPIYGSLGVKRLIVTASDSHGRQRGRGGSRQRVFLTGFLKKIAIKERRKCTKCQY